MEIKDKFKVGTRVRVVKDVSRFDKIIVPGMEGIICPPTDNCWDIEIQFDNGVRVDHDFDGGYVDTGCYEVISPIPEIEFGQVVGSLGWAYEVAKEEGEVFHKGNIKSRATIHEEIKVLQWDCGVTVGLYSNHINGWTRKHKLTDKEEFEVAVAESRIYGVGRQSEKLLELFEVTKK